MYNSNFIGRSCSVKHICPMNSNDCWFDRDFSKPVLNKVIGAHFEGAQIYIATKGKYCKFRLEKWIILDVIHHSRFITVVSCDVCTGNMKRHKYRPLFRVDGSAFVDILRKIIGYIEEPEMSQRIKLAITSQ